MKLSLKNYSKIISAAILKAAEKYNVRECDETGKGLFVAYIDKGDHTFDVSLSVNAALAITAASCDCGDHAEFCVHKIALLVHLAQNKKTRSAKIKTTGKKKTEAEQLLEEISHEEIKEWLGNVLAKSADIRFSFVNHFKSAHKKYTPEECVTLTQNVWKAVVRSKKNIDPTQLKKVIELWGEAHQNIISQYLQNVCDANAFLCIHSIIQTCGYYYQTSQINSVRIPRYVEQMLHQTRQTITELHTEEAWNTATGYIIAHVADKVQGLRMYYLAHLTTMCEVVSESRRHKLLNQLMNQYRELYHEGLWEAKAYTLHLFDIVNKYHLFADFVTCFKPLYFENDFNYKLISALIKLENYSLAEQYCQEQINGNYKEEYNISYWILLKNIYRATDETTKLMEVLRILLPFTFSFEDYVYINEKMTNEEERKKWRAQILSRAKSAYHNKDEAGRFYIRVLHSEGNIKKMIQEASSSLFSYEQIAEYFDIMAATDRLKLLDALIGRNTEYAHFYHPPGEDQSETAIAQIAQKLCTVFDKSLIQQIIAKREINRWYQPNRLVALLKQKWM